MLTTPLHREHKNRKAKMIEFAGYHMPVSFSSVKEEYLAVRQNCGVFDISHMLPIWLGGNNCQEMLDAITSRRLNRMANGQVQYNVLLNEQAGVVDDVTFYRLAENNYIVIANAANKNKVINHLEQAQKKFPQVDVIPYEEYILLAVQGPQAEEVLKKTNIDRSFLKTFYYEFVVLPNEQESFQNKLPPIISRTGYTGEDGFEILLSQKKGKNLWQELLQQGAVPCGLAARDVLRMEVFYPLYGQELSLERTPLQSGLSWLVDWDKDFEGKEIMLAQKEQGHDRVRGFWLEEGGGVPRSGFAIFNDKDEKVGEVTSGSFSFLQNKGFGLAYLEQKYSKANLFLWLDIRGKKQKIKTFATSPYKGSIKKR